MFTNRIPEFPIRRACRAVADIRWQLDQSRALDLLRSPLGPLGHHHTGEPVTPTAAAIHYFHTPARRRGPRSLSDVERDLDMRLDYGRGLLDEDGE